MGDDKQLLALSRRVREIESTLQSLAVLLAYAGNPDGLLTAREGTFCWDTTGHNLYVNVSTVEGTDWSPKSTNDPDGTLVFYDDATVWDDLRAPASSLRLPTANPPTVRAYKGGQVLGFSSASDNWVYLVFQIPHGYKEGSDIYLHLHWTIPVSGAAGGAENVKWDVTYSWANIFDTFPVESSDTVTRDVQNDVADTHLLSEWTAIAGAGMTISSMLILSLKRDTGVANDYASEAYLLEVDIHYEMDTVGSREELTK